MNVWIEYKERFKQFEILFYEDFKTDVEKQLLKINNILNLNIKNSLIQKTIKYGSIENMRELQHSNKLNWFALKGTGKGAKVRKGKTGGYKEELQQKDIDFLNDYIKQNLNPVFLRYILT